MPFDSHSSQQSSSFRHSVDIPLHSMYRPFPLTPPPPLATPPTPPPDGPLVPKRSSSYSSAVLAIACARPLHPSQSIPSHHCPVASNLFTNPASAIFRPPRSMPHTAAPFFAAFAVLSSPHVFTKMSSQKCLHHPGWKHMSSPPVFTSMIRGGEPSQSARADSTPHPLLLPPFPLPVSSGCVSRSCSGVLSSYCVGTWVGISAKRCESSPTPRRSW